MVCDNRLVSAPTSRHLHTTTLPTPHPTHTTPGQRYEARLDKTLLPLITLQDVNQRAALLTHTNSAVFKSVEHRCVCGGGGVRV